MKFILILFLLLSMNCLSQKVNIPDTNFRTYLLRNPKINLNGDSIITVQEAEEFNDSIIVHGTKIRSLTGIEAFVNIRYLNCAVNPLTELDLSKNTALTFLNCNFNSLVTLDLSQNKSLTHLFCYHNSIYILNLKNNHLLQQLDCRHNEIQYSLDLSNNVNLSNFSCSNNQDLKFIFVPDRKLAEETFVKSYQQKWFQKAPNADQQIFQKELDDSIQKWKMEFEKQEFKDAVSDLFYSEQGSYFYFGVSNRFELKTYGLGAEFKLYDAFYSPFFSASLYSNYRHLFAGKNSALPSNCISIGVHFTIFGLEILCYFDPHQSWFYLNPKIGIDWGNLSIFYGYSISLNDSPYRGVYGHNLALNYDLYLDAWKHYRMRKKNGYGY